MLQLSNLILVLLLDKWHHLPPVLILITWLSNNHLIPCLSFIEIRHNLATLILFSRLLLYDLKLLFQTSDLINKALRVVYRGASHFRECLLNIRPIAVQHMLGVWRHALEIARTRFFEGVSLAWIWTKSVWFLNWRDGRLIVNSLVFLKGHLSFLNHFVNKGLGNDLFLGHLSVTKGATSLCFILNLGTSVCLRLIQVGSRN